MSFAKGICPVCGGPVSEEEEGLKCFTCARVVPRLQAMKAYYDKYKQPILEDLDKLGMAKTRKKWRIPSSTIHGLRVRWGSIKRSLRSELPAPERNGHLPELPAFSSEWTEAVQLKWLAVWGSRR